MTTALEAIGAVPTAVMDAALGLPPEARRRLADLLLESLAAPGSLSPEWKEELARRLRAEEAGQMRFYTPDEVDAHLAAVDAETRGS